MKVASSGGKRALVALIMVLLAFTALLATTISSSQCSRKNVLPETFQRSNIVVEEVLLTYCNAELSHAIIGTTPSPSK